MFKNRQEAGLKLSSALKKMNIKFDIVMAVPRGGVIVADIIAQESETPLDVVLAKKIGSPNLPEYAIGAVTPDGEIMTHAIMVQNPDIAAEEIESLAEHVKEEINYRLNMYRSSNYAVDIAGKDVLLVDDGIATGFTMKAAIKYLRRLKARKVYIAVPVSSSSAFHDIKKAADFMLVLETPDKFYAVGQFYQEFDEVDDKQVVTILERASKYPITIG